MFAITRYLAVTAAVLFAAPASAAELVMVEQQGCEWCELWNEEIGPIYPKTTEGRFAPLRRVDIGDVRSTLNTARRVNFTPTFLVVEEGHEVARLEGYPGEDFFWPVLAKLLSENTDFDSETFGSN